MTRPAPGSLAWLAKQTPKETTVNDKIASLNTPEPAPLPSTATPVWEMVLADMRERHEFGVAKYGTPLTAGNGRRPLVDAYQEALDLSVYLRQAIEQHNAMAARNAELEALLAEEQPLRHQYGTEAAVLRVEVAGLRRERDEARAEVERLKAPLAHHSTPARFTEFLGSIVEDGSWQYDDGESMTADAQAHLAEVERLRDHLVDAQDALFRLVDVAKMQRCDERALRAIAAAETLLHGARPTPPPSSTDGGQGQSSDTPGASTGSGSSSEAGASPCAAGGDSSDEVAS